MRFQCPYCKGIVAVDSADLGVAVQCGHCSQVVTVPTSRVAPGVVIGDFIIIRELGRGGMGVVYLAHQISLDRPAALKILSDTYANNAEFVVGFIKEARAAAKLNHPNIVQAYAVGEDEGVFYFAMENVDGETMKHVLEREQKIPVDQGLAIIQQIAEALDYAWKEQRLIHRDIKPDNIMLTTNGRAKLADLGLARVAGDIDDSEDDEVMGTPQYISPEHLTGAPMDVRSDIYSLGATFYHFLTGRFPFEGRNAVEIARKHLEQPLIPPNQINRSIPAGVSHIIERMMAKNPKQRYQDAEQLVDDLRLARHGKEPMTATSTLHLTGSTGIRRPNGTKLTSRRKTTEHATVRSSTENFTNTHTSTNVHTRTSSINLSNLSHMRTEQAKRRKMILFGMIGAIAVIGIVLVVLLSRGSGSPKPIKPAPVTGPNTRENNPEKPKNNLPKSTPYVVKAQKLLAFVRNNTDRRSDILTQCEDFLVAFPNPQYKMEWELLDALMTAYVPIDEIRLEERIRKKYRENHRNVILEKKARYDEEVKQKEEERLLAEKRKVEEQKRLEEQQRKQKEREARESYVKKELDAIRKQAVERKAKMTNDMLNALTRGEVKSALDVFEPLQKEYEAAQQKDQENDKRISTEYRKHFMDWTKPFKDGMKMLMTASDSISDSGEALSGVVVEVGRERCKIQSIRKGTGTFLAPGNRRKLESISSLSERQYEKLLHKTVMGLPDGDKTFPLVLFAFGDFEMALEQAPAPLKKELSPMVQNYFTQVLKQGAAQEKNRLKKRYGSMEEFTKAENAAKR